LANLLKRELEFDIILINEWVKYINQDLHFLHWAQPLYYFSARYDLFQNIFIDMAFKSGIIYNLLDNDKVKVIAEILSLFTKERKKNILDRIHILKNKDVVEIDDEGVPTTGEDYIEMILEDELEIIRKTQYDIKQIIPLIKYEETELKKMITQAICFIQKSLKRYN